MRHHISLFLLCGFLAGCSQVTTPSTATAELAAVQRGTVDGFISLDQPLSHVSVQLLSSSNQPLVSAQSYRNGGFDLLTDQAPKQFTVAVNSSWNAEPVALRAVVQNNTGQFVRVNLLTTLVAAYLDQHPGQTSAQAERAIKILLKLPAGVRLTRNVSPRLFNPQVFITQAEAVGGINRFIVQLAAQAGSSTVHSFAASAPLQPQGLTDGAMGFLLSNAAKGFGKGAGSFIAKTLWAAVSGQQDSSAQLSQISDQINEIDQKMRMLDADINDLKRTISPKLDDIQKDVDFNDFNTIYNMDLAPIISKNEQASDMLEGIFSSAGAEAPNAKLIKRKIDNLYTFVDDNYEIKHPTQAAYNVGRWKEFLISNGIGARGVVQAWSHYIASSRALYNQTSAEEVQNQWDFLDAQWLLYTSLTLSGLEHGGTLDDAARQDVLTAWAKNRQAAVMALRGGTKSASELNAGLTFPEAQDASFNSFIAQSIPTPLPKDVLINQNDQTLWWTRPAFSRQIGVTNSNDLTYGPVELVAGTLNTQTAGAAQAAVGAGAWQMPDLTAYANLQTSLTSMQQGFRDAGFQMSPDLGTNKMLIPIVQLPFYDVSDSDGRETARAEGKYVFDPDEFLKTLPYASHDAGFQGDSDFPQGCPVGTPDWNSTQTLMNSGNLYYLAFAAIYDYGFFKDHKYAVGTHIRNRDWVGCSANTQDVYNMQGSATWTVYAERPLLTGEHYTY